MKEKLTQDDIRKILEGFYNIADALEEIENKHTEIVGEIVSIANAMGLGKFDNLHENKDPRVSNYSSSDSRPGGPGAGEGGLLERMTVAQIKSSRLPEWFIKWVRYLAGYNGHKAQLLLNGNSMDFGFTPEAAQSIAENSEKIKATANYHLSSPMCNFENFIDDLEGILGWPSNDAACLALQLTIEYYKEVG